MKRIGWIWTIVAVVVLASVLFFRTYYNIHAEIWRENRDVTEAVYDGKDLARIDKIQTFVGEQPLKVVFGESEDGRSIITWIEEQTTYTAFTDEGISKEQLLQYWREADPQKQLLRIMPGKLDEHYVWEIFYYKKVDGKKIYYYDYYRFADGQHIDTYLLTLK